MEQKVEGLAFKTCVTVTFYDGTFLYFRAKDLELVSASPSAFPNEE
jgi:hypothetical protein